MKHSLVSIVALLLVSVPGLSQQEERVTHFLTLSPSELIKLLPATPPEWKATSSIASNQLSAWLFAIAQKSMEYTPPPPAPKPGEAAPEPITMKTSITLMDTGGLDMSGRVFEKFKPGVADNRESVVVNGCPAVITKVSDVRESLNMGIGKRFVISLATENQPAGTAKKWAAMIDVAKLLSIARASAPIAKLPGQVQIELVDELNPKNNRQRIQELAIDPKERGKGE